MKDLEAIKIIMNRDDFPPEKDSSLSNMNSGQMASQMSLEKAIGSNSNSNADGSDSPKIDRRTMERLTREQILRTLTPEYVVNSINSSIYPSIR